MNVDGLALRNRLRDQSGGDLTVLVNCLQWLHGLLVDALQVTKDGQNQVLLQIVLQTKFNKKL